jgi:hypothetical protein
MTLGDRVSPVAEPAPCSRQNLAPKHNKEMKFCGFFLPNS